MSERELVTAADMDNMTPNERAEAVRASIVTDWAQVPAEFRAKITTTANRLIAEREAARSA